ncbi:UDP-4-amino-4-deoxy-L-arabinose--oxoglutarate aminotransferase [subsurface metagenome]
MSTEMKKIPFGRPVFSGRELEEIRKVLDSGILTHGPVTRKFEEVFAGFIGTEFALAVSSCTAALHLSLMALDIGPGDEVIVPAMTHTATAHVVELCGAKPVFADVLLRTGNIDVEKIEKKITSRTRAIEVVHFLGLPGPMDEIDAIVEKKNLSIIEDCALSLGALYKGRKTGSLGLTGNFSFYPIKHITTSEGGMLTTNDERIASHACRQRAFGIDRSIEERKTPGIYDVKYLGNNYRMSEIQAALGLLQMEAFQVFNKKRQNNYMKLRTLLEDIPTIEVFQELEKDLISAHYCLNIIVRENCDLSREEVVSQLNNLGVGTSVYYGRPVPLMSYYSQKYGYAPGDFPNAEFISNNSIALPVGPHLNEEDMVYIAECVKKVCIWV